MRFRVKSPFSNYSGVVWTGLNITVKLSSICLQTQKSRGQFTSKRENQYGGYRE